MLRREKKLVEAVRQDTVGLLVHHRFGEEVKHRTKNGIALVKEARGTTRFGAPWHSSSTIQKQKTAWRRSCRYDTVRHSVHENRPMKRPLITRLEEACYGKGPHTVI